MKSIFVVGLSWFLISTLGLSIFKSHADDHQLNFEDEVGQVSSEYIFKNPEEFKNETYCYFVFQGAIDSTQVTPALYAKFVKGSTLSNSALPDYRSWLNRDEGKKCRRQVGPRFNSFKADAAKQYSIFLNYKSIEADGQSPETTLTHEKLHVLFAIRKNERRKIEAAWNQLSDQEKTAFEKKHVGYNYPHPEIALREYFSYTYENSPAAAEKLLNQP